MRTKFKAWAEPYLKEHSEITWSLDHLNDVFSFNLEIGSGKGLFISSMAMKFPDECFIGIERNVTCAGFCAKKIVENKINNAKLIWGDASQILPLFKDNIVKTIFLNFSDPWPKKRQAKRRLTSTYFIEHYYRILQKGGRLYFKSDNEQLFNYSLEVLESFPFKVINIDKDYDGQDEIDFCTEYENNFREKNMPIYRFILEKL